MSAAGAGRGFAGLLAIIGGILILAGWGMYVSLWAVLGAALGFLGIASGAFMMREEYARGGTTALAVAIIAWAFYPNPITMIITGALALLAVGGIIGYILELTV
jgi:hypothetical protein